MLSSSVGFQDDADGFGDTPHVATWLKSAFINATTLLHISNWQKSK